MDPFYKLFKRYIQPLGNKIKNYFNNLWLKYHLNKNVKILTVPSSSGPRSGARGPQECRAMRPEIPENASISEDDTFKPPNTPLQLHIHHPAHMRKTYPPSSPLYPRLLS
jgi:hypothetical protein